MATSTGAARPADGALSAGARPTAKSDHTRTGTRWYGCTQNAARTGSRNTRNRVTGFLARRIIHFQPPRMPRHRPQVDAVAVVVVRRRHAVQHDRQFNWLALLIERHLLGKLGRLDLA